MNKEEFEEFCLRTGLEYDGYWNEFSSYTITLKKAGYTTPREYLYVLIGHSNEIGYYIYDVKICKDSSRCSIDYNDITPSKSISIPGTTQFQKLEKFIEIIRE